MRLTPPQCHALLLAYDRQYARQDAIHPQTLESLLAHDLAGSADPVYWLTYDGHRAAERLLAKP